jgi:four helix bundle protein
MTSKSFQDLVAWQKAHQFVLDCYRYTSGFPREEMFVLTSQMRRAAIAIPANIAEGFRKRTSADKLHYNIEQGSTEESSYYLILAPDLGYGNVSHLRPQLNEVSKLLEAYTQTIRRRPQKP